LTSSATAKFHFCKKSELIVESNKDIEPKDIFEMGSNNVMWMQVQKEVG
jgi:hypothetical protein